MEENNEHSIRLAFALTVLVVALVLISIDQFNGGGDTTQQAAVLGVYAD